MVMMRRAILVVAFLLLVVGMATASPAVAQPTAGNPTDVAADFNRDGFADLAVGGPGQNDIHGGVNVLYGSAGGLTTAGGRLLTKVGSAPEEQDWFGWALAAGDFNHDGFADLAVGAPFETVGGAFAAGAVNVLYGSAGGLTASGGRLFTQVAGNPEVGDQFGSTLAAGDFNQDGFADLAAGAPLEDVGTVDDAGAFSTLYGSTSGLTTSGGRLFTQVAGPVEAGGEFGEQP